MAFYNLLVAEYFLGACFQILGCLGGLWLYKKLKPQKQLKDTLKEGLDAFVIFTVFEASFIALLSFLSLSQPLLLQVWFWCKALLGVAYLIPKLQIYKEFLYQNKCLALLSCLLTVSISVPTANFDCFSAHFAIPRLFLEAGAYPIRPDYQYLDALPLSGHMWYLPGMAAGFEGALNIISPIYSIATVLLIQAYHNKRVAFISMLLLFSMPIWIRVSLDPMMDTPSCFYALYTMCLATRLNSKPQYWKNYLLTSCFLIALKPTMIVFPFVALGMLVFHFNKLKFKTLDLMFILLCLFAGGLWYFKNAYLYNNPLYPYLFSNSIAPIIPVEIIPEKSSLATSLLSYLKVIFADYRWVLSLGPWPLFGAPFLVLGFKHKKARLLLLYLVLGFLVTWFFTSFKNRYFLPYLILSVPLLALFISKGPTWLSKLTFVHSLTTLAMFSPYLLQPFYASYKGLDYESYMNFKYPKYRVFKEVNESDASNVLLVGQPAYWLTKPHQLAIISETYLDFTKIQSLQELIAHLKEHEIDTIIFDYSDVEGMAEKTDPYYWKKAYQAQVCLSWMKQLLSSDQVELIMDQEKVSVSKIHY